MVALVTVVPMVLVVDDDPSIRLLLREVLRDEGYGVCVAANGREALEAVERHTPNLIVLDLMMPVMDGREFCRAIAPRQRDADQRVPVLAISAEYGAYAQAHDLGVDAFLAKPFDIDELLTEVARLRR
jgi:two-component system response regulator MprA